MDIDNGRVAHALRDGRCGGTAGREHRPLPPVGWDELHPGGWDPAERLKEQDRDGVAPR